jgi:hypothetical protein
MQKNWLKAKKSKPKSGQQKEDEPFNYKKGFWLLLWALIIQTTAFFIT